MLAHNIVISASWDTDLNSENNKGVKHNIIRIVVFKIAEPVWVTIELSAISFDLPFLIECVYALIRWMESSMIRPKTIVKINAFDKLK